MIQTEPIKSWHDRVTPEADFTRCFRLEDDFSYQQGKGNIWLIEEIDLRRAESHRPVDLEAGRGRRSFRRF